MTILRTLGSGLETLAILFSPVKHTDYYKGRSDADVELKGNDAYNTLKKYNEEHDRNEVSSINYEEHLQIMKDCLETFQARRNINDYKPMKKKYRKISKKLDYFS